MKKKIAIVMAMFMICIVVYIVVLPPLWKGKINNFILPGQETTNLEHLHPQLKPKIESILSSLKKKGYSPRIAAVYRSQSRQDAIMFLSNIETIIGFAPSTKAPKSCHSFALKDGTPASKAIDLQGFSPSDSTEKNAKFFLELRELAVAQGLVSGGSQKPQNARWAKYDLGWDPAHIQLPKCY